MDDAWAEQCRKDAEIWEIVEAVIELNLSYETVGIMYGRKASEIEQIVLSRVMPKRGD